MTVPDELGVSGLEAGPHEGEPHEGGINNRLNGLRAGVLGANDGIVSTAGLVMGVAGATSDRGSALPFTAPPQEPRGIRGHRRIIGRRRSDHREGKMNVASFAYCSRRSVLSLGRCRR